MAPKSRRLNRARVIEQAAQLADEAGDAGAVTLASLAQALDIRTPSLYNHIASLDDLRYGMAVYGVAQLLHAMRHAAAGRAGRGAVEAMAHAYRRFARAHPGIYPLTVRAPAPEENELMAVAQELIQLLLLVMGSLGLRGADALHAIRGLRAVLHGFAALEAAEGYKLDLDREESFRRLLAAYLAGMTR